MNPDPTLRVSFWSAVVGNLVLWLSFVGCNPSTMQRFLAVPTFKSAKMLLSSFFDLLLSKTFFYRSLLILGVGIIITKAICCYCGLIIYAKFADCDPLTSKQIDRPDQILPYYVLDVASHVPGISGLFVAGVFSTALRYFILS